MAVEKKNMLIEAYGKNLVELARKNLLDPVIGRDKEIEQLIQVLSKRKKNNPLIVGEAGVGKCICSDTMVVLRNDLTGEVLRVSIDDFLNTVPNSR
jgi:ATP-dependent Clp protease ATP-binding subunit ClpA